MRRDYKSKNTIKVMETSSIILVPKFTKVEHDMRRLGLNKEELLRFYEREGLNVKKIFESHNEQKENLRKVLKIFKGANILSRDKLTRSIASKSSLVVAFGGDNHFQYVSHFLDKTPILGINSDPKRSEGALISLNVEELENNFENLSLGKFKIEEWTRAKVEINGRKVEEPSISEIFIGENNRFDMSRYILELNGKEEEQKSSGLIITTGAGSTGWYNSASRYMFPKGNVFDKKMKELRFLTTEPHNGKLSKLKMLSGKIKNDEKLNIVSLSDSNAAISIDSLKIIKLREGSKISIEMGEPLKVLKLK